jgi:two-component sensor histidine kinase
MERKLPSRLTDLLAAEAPGDDTLLLRELQHRHASDLTVVVAALMVCGRKLRPGSPRATMLREIARKVQAIGEINMILGTQGAGFEDLAPTLEMLCEAAERRGPANLLILVSAQSVIVRDFVCRRIALVVNELIINAVKHGPTDGSQMIVKVKLADNGDGTQVSVENDGHAARWERAGGEGTGLVDEMVSRLGGEVIRTTLSRSVRVSLVFPTLAVRQIEEPF